MSLMRPSSVDTQVHPRRVLLLENAPRDVGDETLAKLYQQSPDAQIDVLTCYDSAPPSFDKARGAVLSVHCEEARRNRMGFVRNLCRRPYDEIAVLALGSPILAAWVLAFAARAYKRIVLIRTAGEFDAVPLHRWYSRPGRQALAQFVQPSRRSTNSLLEASLTAASRIMAAPFAVIYLTLFTLRLHAARHLRKVFARRIESV